MQEALEMWFRSLVQIDPLKEKMATHSSILAWEILWAEELGGLHSMALQRIGHNWATEHWSFLACRLVTLISASVFTWWSLCVCFLSLSFPCLLRTPSARFWVHLLQRIFLSLLQGNLPNPGIEPGSPALQADSLPAELPGNPSIHYMCVYKK